MKYEMLLRPRLVAGDSGNEGSIYLMREAGGRKHAWATVIATVNTEPYELIAKTTVRPHLHSRHTKKCRKCSALVDERL